MRTGRPPKDPDAKVGHYKPKLQIVPAVPAEVTDAAPFIVPEPPLTPAGDRLLDSILLLWDRFWLSPVARALDGPGGLDQHIVEHWIQLENKLLVLEIEVGTDFTVTGSKGQIRPNPLSNEAASIRTQLEKLWQQLGIGSKNKAQLGIVTGQDRLTAADVNERLGKIAQGGEPSDYIDGEFSEVESFEEWQLEELKVEARELGIRGRSTMRRAELEVAIAEAWASA